MSAKKTEIAFWDTSALVPLCCAQPGSTSRTRTLLRRFGRPVIWWGTAIEIHSALSRLHEEGALSDRGLINSFKRWEVIESISREIIPTEQVKRLAKSLPGQYRIRSLDSFQLAAALVWCQEKPRRRPFICFDERLAQAAEKAGFSVYPSVT